MWFHRPPFVSLPRTPKILGMHKTLVPDSGDEGRLIV